MNESRGSRAEVKTDDVRSREKIKSLRGKADMLWTIFAILVVLWLLGMVTAYAIGGVFYLLLILGIITIMHRLLTGRRSA